MTVLVSSLQFDNRFDNNQANTHQNWADKLDVERLDLPVIDAMKPTYANAGSSGWALSLGVPRRRHHQPATRRATRPG
jgi:hypothetical protein